MTKEEIREKYLNRNGLSVNKSDVGKRIQKAAFEAMDEYAKQEAIGFANFVGNRPIPEYSASTNKWRWWSNEKREYEYATTEELYSLYQQNKK